MSTLEQELVFELMENGSTAEDILEIAENIRNPNLSKIPPINLNQKRVEQAIQRYEFKKDYETFKKKERKIKKEAKRKKKELIKQEIARLKEDPATLKIEIKNTTTYDNKCPSCDLDSFIHFYAKRIILERSKNGTFVKNKKYDEFFLNYCTKCYFISTGVKNNILKPSS